MSVEDALREYRNNQVATVFGVFALVLLSIIVILVAEAFVLAYGVNVLIGPVFNTHVRPHHMLCVAMLTRALLPADRSAAKIDKITRFIGVPREPVTYTRAIGTLARALGAQALLLAMFWLCHVMSNALKGVGY